jgi:hypothetical protein
VTKGRPLAADAAIVVALSLAACAPPVSPSLAPTAGGSTGATSPAPTSAATTAPTPQGSLTREQAWADDLSRIVPGLDRIHPDPFRHTSRAEMEAAVADLSARAGTLTDDELMVGVLRIAALVSAGGCDGHTGGFPWGAGGYPMDSLPLRLWLFPTEVAGEPVDELVVVDALPPYEDLVGARIDSIEGRPTGEVREALEPVIPRDNDQTVRLLTPRYLLIPQVLRGLGLADDGPVTLELTARDGTSRAVDVEPVPMAEYNAWAGPYGLHLPADPAVRYLSNIDEDLWWELLPDETLYVQYNRVERIGAEIEDLRAAVTDPAVGRVVLDIRHNFGGEVPALDPMMDVLDDPAVDRPDRLFVLVGRNTWSAGSMLMARLEARTGAVFIGEPMAGCPTFYGDIVELRLPHSGLVLLVAEMLEVGVDPDDARLNVDLDIAIDLTQDDWEEGRDPALETIVAAGP